MTDVAGDTAPSRKYAVNPRILAVAAAAFFLASSLVRHYREVTISLTLVFAGWAAFEYWRSRRR